MIEGSKNPEFYRTLGKYILGANIREPKGFLVIQAGIAFPVSLDGLVNANPSLKVTELPNKCTFISA